MDTNSFSKNVSSIVFFYLKGPHFVWDTSVLLLHQQPPPPNKYSSPLSDDNGLSSILRGLKKKKISKIMTLLHIGEGPGIKAGCTWPHCAAKAVLQIVFFAVAKGQNRFWQLRQPGAETHVSGWGGGPPPTPRKFW